MEGSFNWTHNNRHSLISLVPSNDIEWLSQPTMEERGCGSLLGVASVVSQPTMEERVG